MKDIRQEIQDWLEVTTRVIKNIPFGEVIHWEDIEDVYNGSHCNSDKPTFKAHSETLTFEDVFCDAITIDHMCSEILGEDFEKALRIFERYKGVVLVNSRGFTKEKSIN